MEEVMLPGANGGISSQTLDVARHHSSEFEIIGLSVGYNMKELTEILGTLSKVRQACVAEEADMEDVQKRYPNHSFCFGDAGLKQSAVNLGYDVLVNAIADFRGPVPTLTVINHDKVVALANEESLVAGSPLIERVLKGHPAALYPIDSEHSAIFQYLQGNALKKVDKLTIMVSGGSSHDRSCTELANITVKEALQHPNWGIGRRITIDSTTMMSKDSEMTEAHYLFDISYDTIDAVIHRESITHSVVQYRGHAIMAQLGTANMRPSIQYVLSYPSRLEMRNAEPFDFQRTFTFHLAPASEERYPLLKLAFTVGRREGNLGAVMSGADEGAIALFPDGKIDFLDIEHYIIKAVGAAVHIAHPSLEGVIESDTQVQEFVHKAWKGGTCTMRAIQ